MNSGYLFGLIVLLGLSAFFSGSETAFTSLSLMDIESLRKKHPRRGALILNLHNRPDNLLSTVLIGNNLVNIALSVLSTQLTIKFFGSLALGYTTGILTLLILIFGEILPKQYAILNNRAIVLYTCQIIYALSVLFYPLIWVLSLLTKLVAKSSKGKGRNSLTLDGILHMIKHAETLGLLETYRSRMVRRVFRFSDVTVHAVMTHRTKVFSLPQNMNLDEALGLITEAGFSRIPVYHKDPEHIVGIVLEKDVIKALYSKALEGKKPEILKEIMLDPVVVPESWKIHRVFGKLKAERLNLAVVLDEYGGLAGVITMEDLVEEIIGELYDEHEEKEIRPIVHNPSGTLTIQGDSPFHLLEDWLGQEIDRDKSVDTVGGYIAAITDSFPQVGDSVALEYGTFVIDKISRKQILKVTFHPNSN